MSTPFDLRLYIENFNHENHSSEDTTKLCELILQQLPQPITSRGKVCINCNFKMHNRRATCPNCKQKSCKAPKRKRKRAEMPEAPPLEKTDCNICGNDASENNFTMSCGHVYHKECLKRFARVRDSCCHCPNIKIPLEFK